MNLFEKQLHASGLQLRRAELQTLQLNLGRKCNQTCRHCHVDASPWRTEMMSEPVARKIGAWITTHRPEVIDLTGGAPELSEWFSFFVELGNQLGLKVMDRNNLTILEVPGFDYLPEFLAKHRVEVVASLPCYQPENVNRQRGNGVFEKSIRGLRKLNAAGYGAELPLHLVYNPVGPKLPPSQEELELEFKSSLQELYGIRFNRLFTITNQPIARFADELRKQNAWDDYLQLLSNSFNPATIEGLMCRGTLSVGYLGELYDCDFNQMLGMHITHGQPLYLWDIQPSDLPGAEILTGDHCLACAAGCGSRCTGSLAA
jgi:radical SAM/Cys-rich protein